jgi:thiol-disulfide isomerase/thioredoxin
MRMIAVTTPRYRCVGSVLLVSALLICGGAATSAGDDATKADAAPQSVEIPAAAYVTLMLARDPAIQSELKLQRMQIDQLSAAVAEVDQPMWVLRDVPIAKSAPELDILLAKFQKHLNRILTAAQRDRLNGVILQARGYKALTSPDVSQRLKLSDKQIGQLKQALSQAKTDDTTLSKKVLDLLSSDQQAELSVMAGKPFDLNRVLRVQCTAPELRDVSLWINSTPLSLSDLRGRVVVVHFWAFGCINCVHNQPHYQAWFERFPESKLTIIGIHTPETERERSVDNLRGNVAERRIAYPVAVDSDSANWKAWGNNMWPSVYLIDKQGRVRAYWYGELNWQGARGEESMRKKIQELLEEPLDR